MPQKKCPGGRRQHRQRPQSVFEKDGAVKRLLKKTIKKLPQKGGQRDAVYSVGALKVFWKRMKQKRPLKVHPPNVGRGTLILFNSIDCGRLSFQLKFFLGGNECQRLFLSNKLLLASVTLFLRILLRDSHSGLKAPHSVCYPYTSALAYTSGRL